MQADTETKQATAGTDEPIGAKAMDWRTLVVSLIVNGLLPWAVYRLMKRYTHTSEMTALAATAVPSLLDALVGIAKRRRIDLLAGFTLFTIAVSLGLVALGGSPKLYLARESLLTGAIGLAVLFSLLWPRPLTFYVLRYFGAGDSPERRAYFDREWEKPDFRRDTRVIALLFGLLTVVEVAVRVRLVFVLPTAHFLAVSPLISYGYAGLLVGAFALYRWLTPETDHGSETDINLDSAEGLSPREPKVDDEPRGPVGIVSK